MGKFEYSAGLVSKLLWFNELKRTAQIQMEIDDPDEVRETIIRDNVYQINKIERSTRIYNYCIKRLKNMDNDLKDILVYGDTSDAKIIALISTMKLEKILFDFVYEVYREKIMLGDYEITEKDMKIFLDYKATQSDEIAEWSESTNAKISPFSMCNEILSTAFLVLS